MCANSKDARICVFCETSSVKKPFFGSCLRLLKYEFHWNCLLFSTDIPHKADNINRTYDLEIRFMEVALHRAQLRICTFCRKKGATIKCCENDCEIAFHLNCALDSKKTLHLPYDKYESYCYDHIPYKCIFDCDKITGMVNKRSKCCDQIYSHDGCIEKYVLNARALTKCPVCFDVNRFKDFINITFNMKIPNGMPSYAQREDTWYDLKCANVSCRCPKGVFYHQKNSNFELICCVNCGSDAIHRLCGGFKTDQVEWICNACDPESQVVVAPIQEVNRKIVNESLNHTYRQGK